MELLSPAGNIEKLRYAYLYGADAAYVGVGQLSLRAKADNFSAEQAEEVRRIKVNKKLYCALNIYFHQPDMEKLEDIFDELETFPFDAFIISDIGIVAPLRRRFPQAELHLSTQANCTNAEAAKVYRDLGFSRIITAREISLKEIEAIKKAVPEVELECFVHGAMCLAYSGRCFLSKWMADRSGNRGGCAHSCRWEYRVLEEKERPGEYYPLIEGENFTTLLSSKDLCLIDHLEDFKNAGVDCLKIEGRMKSLYYIAVVTRAYRKALDKLNHSGAEDPAPYREELFNVSHREFCTGFYYGKEQVEQSTDTSYERHYTFLGTLGAPADIPGRFHLNIKNKIRRGETLEWIGPDFIKQEDDSFLLFDKKGEAVDEADHGRIHTIQPGFSEAREGFILRRKNKKKTEKNP